MAVCAGGVSLTPEDRVEVLAILAADPDPSVAERALNVLLTQPVDYFIKALERSIPTPCSFAIAPKILGRGRESRTRWQRTPVAPRLMSRAWPGA